MIKDWTSKPNSADKFLLGKIIIGYLDFNKINY